MKRTVTPELLDLDDWAAPAIATALRDLRRINRWFGGISSMTAILARVAAAAGIRRLSVLDVAGSTGEVMAGVGERLRRRGIELEAVIMDRAPSHLRPGLTGLAGDALALPFRDGSFDVVASNLFVHHLAPEQVRAFAQEALRVSRFALVIDDLRRSLLHLLLVYAGLPLFRSRLTHQDAPASVRAAYTVEEMRAMLHPAAAERIETTRHYLYRMGVIAWKR
jgi:ubiquinone/menaquinone biosynthesis C-methylase UbiE